MKFRNLSLKITIAAGFAAVIIISGIIALSTYLNVSNLSKTQTEFIDIEAKKNHVDNFLVHYLKSQVALNSMVTVDLGTEEEDFNTALSNMESSAEKIDDLLNSVRGVTDDYSDAVNNLLRVKRLMSEESDFATLMQLNSEYESSTLKLSAINSQIFGVIENTNACRFPL